MIDYQDLDAAVAARVLTAEQRAALIDLSRERAQPSLGADEENFRFITGFNDIFVTIAAVLLLTALATLGARILPDAIGGGVGVAIGSWVLAEYFTGRRRMALPSIVLLIAFIGGLFAVGVGLAESAGLLGPSPEPPVGAFVGAAALAVAGAIAHWRRFRVPITIAAGALAAVALVASLVGFGLMSAGIEGKAAEDILLATGFVGGLIVFALAMRFDMGDRERLTRRTDIAFWLHLLAAPLLVHPLFVLLGLFGGELGTGQAVAVVAIYLALTVVALMIDRRALLVSALAYVIYAIFALFRTADAIDLQVALSCLVIGSFLVMLSAAWRQIRGRVMTWVPENVAARLPVSAAA